MNLREDAPLTKWDADASFYNRGKAECERRLHAILGEKLTSVRPGPIKGVRDDTPDVLTWLKRLQKYHVVAAPGDGTSLLEVVDVKDVAEFLLLAVDRSLFGAFNLTGRPMSFRDFLNGCKSATHSDATQSACVLPRRTAHPWHRHLRAGLIQPGGVNHVSGTFCIGKPNAQLVASALCS